MYRNFVYNESVATGQIFISQFNQHENNTLLFIWFFFDLHFSKSYSGVRKRLEKDVFHTRKHFDRDNPDHKPYIIDLYKEKTKKPTKQLYS
jgi:hypothetical protein